MEAYRYADGSVGYPGHPVGPDGADPVGTVDLTDHVAEVVTWTVSHATPPGVRAIGQLTTADVEVGDEVRPVRCEELRDPSVCLRERESQSWDGYRFEPV